MGVKNHIINPGGGRKKCIAVLRKEDIWGGSKSKVSIIRPGVLNNQGAARKGNDKKEKKEKVEKDRSGTPPRKIWGYGTRKLKGETHYYRVNH